MTPFAFVTSVCLVFALAACENRKDGASSESPGAPPALKAPDPPITTPTPTIGLAECDVYFVEAFRCTAKLDPRLRASSERAILEAVPGWKALAATPANRATLDEQCNSQRDRVKAKPLCL
jgi:hypothetical protein